jgi:hypothetical protein
MQALEDKRELDGNRITVEYPKDDGSRGARGGGGGGSGGGRGVAGGVVGPSGAGPPDLEGIRNSLAQQLDIQRQQLLAKQKEVRLHLEDMSMLWMKNANVVPDLVLSLLVCSTDAGKRTRRGAARTRAAAAAGPAHGHASPRSVAGPGRAGRTPDGRSGGATDGRLCRHGQWASAHGQRTSGHGRRPDGWRHGRWNGGRGCSRARRCRGCVATAL